MIIVLLRYLSNNRIDNQVIEEIIMHFDNTKIVLENELPSEIMLSKPNQESLFYQVE